MEIIILKYIKFGAKYLMKPKLAICYRIYPAISKIPAIHADNKYKMSELCLRSFVRALDGIEPRIWVLLDNCNQHYNDLFIKYLQPYQYELINLNKKGNAGTFGMQMDILSKQNFSNYIYFAEDDYFYLENAFLNTINVLINNNTEFATPYNHPDYDNLPLHNYKYSIENLNGINWRNAASTTMSFMTTKNNLKKYYKIFDSYTKLNYDASMWFAITKLNLKNPFNILKLSLSNITYFKIFLKTFYFAPLAPFGKSAKLISPIKSLATHLDNQGLPPGIDWDKEFEKLNYGL